VIWWVPAVSAAVMTSRIPAPLALAEPIAATPSYSVTVAKASADPRKIGVVTDVILSLFDLPLSVAACRSGVIAVTVRAVNAELGSSVA
jgi:hypothetical protein